MEAISIRKLRMQTRIGIYPRERIVAQTLSIDLDIGLPGDQVFQSGKLADTIDYAEVALSIERLAADRHYNLVETLADRIARLVIASFGASWVKVAVAKVGALRNAEYIGVSVTRRSAAG